jgi:glycosyltransferase involved in cell wall biosynthesis
VAEPLVSAVILAWECESYVGEAIASVRGQTYGNVEVVFVDNGSTDATAAVAEQIGVDIRAHITPNRGICPGRNVGLALARGDFIGFLDGDDVWDPDKTERQLAVLQGESPPDLVLGQLTEFASPELAPERAAELPVRPEPRAARVLGTMLAPRQTWERVGPWTEEYVGSDGLDWFLRAERAGMREVMLDRVVSRRRIHGGNVTLRQPEGREEFARILKTRLDERRGETS